MGFLKRVQTLSAIFVATAVTAACVETSTTAPPKAVGATGCTSSATGSASFQGATSGSALTSSTAQISWNPSTDPSCSYIYRIYQIPNLSSPVAYATGSVSAGLVTGLTAGQTYQFVARMYDGKSEDTNIKVISITMPSPPIGSFNITSMVSGTNHKPTISWTAATNAQSYDLTVSWDLDSTHSEAIVLQEVDLTTTTYTPSTDLPFGKYWITVTAKAPNATSVNASNAPYAFSVYPQLTGCLQSYQLTYNYYNTPARPTTGWQSNCTGSSGMDNGYFMNPGGMAFDPATGYLYINDYYGLARWDTNSFQSLGFMNVRNGGVFASGNYSTDYNNYAGFYPSQASYGNAYPYVASMYGGCSDGTYVYLPGVARVYRIKMSTQALDGMIGGGVDGWQTSGIPGWGTSYRHFGIAAVGPTVAGTLGGVACNSSDPYIYVADTGNHRISRWHKNGTASGVWGTGTGTAWTTTVPATCCTPPAGGSWNGTPFTTAGQVTTSQAGLASPTAIALSAAGNLYIADKAAYANGMPRFSKIAAADLAAPYISGWQCNAVSGYTATVYASCNPVQLAQITDYGGDAFQLAVDSNENLYITSSERKVVKLGSNGAVSAQTNNGYPFTDARFLDPRGVAVKPDGSMVFVSDWSGARIMIYDGNLNYLGYFGAGVNGIAPPTATRPPTMGIGNYWNSPIVGSMQRGIIIDKGTDSFIVRDRLWSADRFIKYSLSLGTMQLDSSTDTNATGSFTTWTAAGSNAKSWDSNYGEGQIIASKAHPYFYALQHTAGRIMRFNRNDLSYQGWMGAGPTGATLTGWQTTTTAGMAANLWGNPKASCAIDYQAHAMYTDNAGYLYLYAVDNRVLVWDESAGTCIGTLGGGNSGMVTTPVVSYTYPFDPRYILGGGYGYGDVAITGLGKYMYIMNGSGGALTRWKNITSPYTLTWNAWMGGAGATGWKTTTTYPGLLINGGVPGDGTAFTLADTGSSIHSAVGGGWYAMLTQNNYVKFIDLADTSYVGSLFAGNSYAFSTTTPPSVPPGYHMGGGGIFAMMNTNPGPGASWGYWDRPTGSIVYDDVGQDMYIATHNAQYGGVAGVLLRYH